MQEECSKYGQILGVKIPRPSGGSRQSAGVGKIFVKFDTVESTTNALKALAGRKFSDRTVVTTYFSEVSFAHTSQLALHILTMHRKTSTSKLGKNCHNFTYYLSCASKFPSLFPFVCSLLSARPENCCRDLVYFVCFIRSEVGW